MAIGFFARSRIQDAATTFAATPTQDIYRWVRDVRRMGARAALLVCDDLLAAYEALGPDVGAEDLVADLARFWVSDPAMRFRRRVAQQLEEGRHQVEQSHGSSDHRPRGRALPVW